MKKYIFILISLLLLTGCGATKEQPIVMSEDSDAVVETSEEAKVEETEDTKGYSEDDLVVWSYYISYDAQTGKQNVLFAEIKNDRMSFNSGDFTSDKYDYTYGKTGASEKSYNYQNSEVKRIFRDCYDSSIATGTDIDSLYLDMAQTFADEKQSASELSPIDISDSFPTTLALTVDGNDYEVDVIHAEFIGVYGSLARSETNAVPCFIDDQGNNMYLDRVQLRLTVPNEQLDPLYTYVERIVEEENALTVEEDVQKDNGENIEQPTDKDTGIIGKWYPGHTDFKEYYIQIDKDGVGSIHRDGEVITLKYTFDGKTLRITDEYGGSRDFYYADGKLASDVDGDIYRKKTAADDSSKSKEQPEQTIDLTGTWYDPTRLSYAEFIFNGDGTGTYDFGNGDTRQMTYSVSGNTISYKLPNSSGTLTIKGDKLYDGESYYVKK